jgi:hypothetical protein
MDKFISCRKKPLMENHLHGLMVLTATTQLTPGIVPKRTILAPLRASRVLIHFQVKKRPVSVMIREKWPP